MRRREFFTKLGSGVLAGGALSACDQSQPTRPNHQSKAATHVFQWKMVTTWPKNFPVIGTGVEQFAQWVDEMSGGRLKIKVYASGELVPAFECLDAVSDGAVQMGHGASYYWQGKNPALQFFSSVPFGMNPLQMNAWLYYGGGLRLWTEAYTPFDVIPIPAGNTGVQMAGWFNREINGVDDFKGLKMRIPGLGGKVLKRMGGTPVTLPGGELLTAMQTRVIDAVEWINPYSDFAFGLHKVAKYYYYPGWHEPGTTLECIVNRKAMESLPRDLRRIILTATRMMNTGMVAEYVAKNKDAIRRIKNLPEVRLRRLSDEILAELRDISEQVVEELAQDSDFSRRIYDSYVQFMQQTQVWLDVSDHAYYSISMS